MANGVLADIYVLSERCEEAFLLAFLETFLPQRQGMAEYYEVPQYSREPEALFDDDLALISYCCMHHHATQAVYYRNPQARAEPRIAMIFFTKDGYVIFGVSINDASREAHYLAELKRFCGSDVGYITYENPPEDDAVTFRQMAGG